MSKIAQSSSTLCTLCVLLGRRCVLAARVRGLSVMSETFANRTGVVEKNWGTKWMHGLWYEQGVMLSWNLGGPTTSYLDTTAGSGWRLTTPPEYSVLCCSQTNGNLNNPPFELVPFERCFKTSLACTMRITPVLSGWRGSGHSTTQHDPAVLPSLNPTALMDSTLC